MCSIIKKNKMKKKKILVCGSTGFIGRNTIEGLVKRDDFEIYGTYNKRDQIDYPGVVMIKVDLTNKNQVDMAIEGKNIIIQLASTTSGAKDIISKPYIHVTDNAVMNSLIFRSAYENEVQQLIFPSCTIMYQSSETPLKENDFKLDDKINPIYFGAGWTKVYLEQMCDFYSRIGNTKFTVFRHSNIYGPYDKFDLEKSHVFGATITKVMYAKNGSKIPVWGTGEEERDLLYVSDIVNFIEKAIDKQKTNYELVNVGYGKPISVRNLVKKIVEKSGKNLEIEYDTSKPTIKTTLSLDSTYAKDTFGWVPLVPLDLGIEKTIKWYRENIQ